MLFPTTPHFAGLWTLHSFHGHGACFCLSRSINEMKRLEEMSNVFQNSGVENRPPEPKTPAEGNEKSKDKEEPWEMVMDKKHFKLWRRPIPGTHLYQYRGEPCLLPLTYVHGAQACGTLFLVLPKLFLPGSVENLPNSCLFSSPR